MSEFSGGDDPILQDLLPGYLARRWDELATMSEAAEREDFETLLTIGHNLHGSGGAYGLNRISILGNELEAAARNRDLELVRETIKKMRAFLEVVSQ